MEAGRTNTAVLAMSATSVTEIGQQLAYLDRIASLSEEVLLRFDALRTYQTDQRDRIAAAEEEAAVELAELRRIERQLVAARAAVEEQTDGVAAVVALQEEALAELDAELSRFSPESSISSSGNRTASRQSSTGRPRAGAALPACCCAPCPVGSRRRSGLADPPDPRHGPYAHRNRHVCSVWPADSKLPPPVGSSSPGGTAGTGDTVMIDHGGGMVTLYAHQSEIRVSATARAVTAGGDDRRIRAHRVWQRARICISRSASVVPRSTPFDYLVGFSGL